MLFNSYEFCLLFLPITFALFWGWHSLRWRLTLLTVASFAFYSFSQFTKEGSPEFDFSALVRSLQITSWADLKHSLWAWRFTIILIASSSVDYFAAKAIVRLPETARGRRKLLLGLSLAANLGLLAFFKYSGFFSEIAHDIARTIGAGKIPVLELVLPVGISFYTFESMSYVIDIYRGVAKPAKSYLDYACFISFFPHLIAGPIIRYSDILHQFRDINWTRRGPDWGQVNLGLILFTMGLVKKLVIADRLAFQINPLWAMLGRDGGSVGGLGPEQAWGAVLGYTFQLYFDFSGYSDMATGLGHMFGVRLPQNFDSPYKAVDPVDFWKRWHMTLGAFLRDYLYIPLGGDGRKRTGPQKSAELTVGTAADGGTSPRGHESGRSGWFRSRNLFITMLLGGLWHGAAWLFILWGAWHGLLLVVTHYIKKAFGKREARTTGDGATRIIEPSTGRNWPAIGLALCAVGFVAWYALRKHLGPPSQDIGFAIIALTLLAGVSLLKRTLPGGEARWSKYISTGLFTIALLFVLEKNGVFGWLLDLTKSRPDDQPAQLRALMSWHRHIPTGAAIILLIPLVSLRRHLTFLLIVIGWVLFRAADVKISSGKGAGVEVLGLQSMRPAWTMFQEMLGMLDVRTVMTAGRRGVETAAVLDPITLWSLIAFSWLWCNFAPNSFQIAYGLRYRWWYAIAAGAAFGICVLHFGVKMDFLYFRF